MIRSIFTLAALTTAAALAAPHDESSDRDGGPSRDQEIQQPSRGSGPESPRTVRQEPQRQQMSQRQDGPQDRQIRQTPQRHSRYEPRDSEISFPGARRRPTESVLRPLQRHDAQLREIHEEHLQRHPNSFGDIALQFVIRASGIVSECIILNSTTGDAALDEAIRDEVSDINFPVSSSSTTVNYTVHLDKSSTTTENSTSTTTTTTSGKTRSINSVE